MTTEEVLTLTKETFALIKGAGTCAELRAIKICGESFNESTYPKLEFSITKGEIEILKEQKVFENGFNFSKELSSKISDPLTKILFATVWKNGDLQKIKHIVQGIVDQGSDKNEYENALVFYQFGKHLTKQPGEPIIDQHVIRAFAVYSEKDTTKIVKLLKLSVLNKTHTEYIDRYKKWLISDELNFELKQDQNYSYEIDKVLFTLGKAIKFSKE